jgi:hypothetical protein
VRDRARSCGATSGRESRMDAYVGSLLIAPYPHLHPRRKKKNPHPS